MILLQMGGQQGVLQEGAREEKGENARMVSKPVVKSVSRHLTIFCGCGVGVEVM